METQNTPKKKRGLKIALIVLAVVAILVLIAVIYGASLWSSIRQNLIPTVKNPNRESVANLATPSAELFDEALRTDIDYYETGEIQEVPIYEQTKIDKYTITLAIVVQQGQIDSEPRQTDMIFLVSYNQLQQKLSIVSLPRDMLLPTHDYGWKRVGAIYGVGGIGLLINTVNDCFGLGIQDYVYTGTDELSQLADAVNGVPATLTEAEAAYVNEQTGSDLTAGKVRLNGQQAVCHLSDRVSDGKGDLGRAQRQLVLINDTFWYLTDNFDREYLVPLLSVIFKCIRTNFEWDTLFDLAYEITVSNDLTITTVRLPFEDAYSEIALDGAYAILPEIEKNKILLQQALFGKE
jgi:LCP family protein required for cell wall assembly